MKLITVIARNHPGEVARLADVLAGAGINIEDIDANTNNDIGVIHLVVDSYDAALRTLSQAGFQAISEDALVIRLDDRAGALAQIAGRFTDPQINLRSMHIVRREAGAVLVSIVTNDNTRAADLLGDVLISRN